MTSTVQGDSGQNGSGHVSGTDTLSERAANLVERDIIAGDLAPGARLGIVDLVQRYEIGATPLREGLSRLISRGLIVGIGQRGFRVAEVSREDLLDITRMRTVVEIEALRLAMAEGDDAWEAGIVSALHQMRRHIQRTGNEFREGAPDFDRLHKGFHTALLAACGSKRTRRSHRSYSVNDCHLADHCAVDFRHPDRSCDATPVGVSGRCDRSSRLVYSLRGRISRRAGRVL